MAKVTPIAQVRTILDAANPAAASAGVLALLEGETLQPGILTLPDFADSVPPLNALGLAGGRLSLGDGVTTAGNPLTPRRVAGMKVCDLTGTNKTSARFAVVGIPMTAAEVANGTFLNVSGTIKLLFDENFYLSEDPVIAATFGFTHNAYKTDATAKWMRVNCLPTSAGETVFIITNHIAGEFELITNATPGINKVVIAPAASKIVSDRWGGAVGNTFSRNSGALAFETISDSSVAIDEAVADTLWLSVEIVMGASGTNGAINFAVVYDLDTAVILP